MTHYPSEIPLGESPFTIDGPTGLLEGLSFGVNDSKGVCIVCHPHPQHEGTMYNKVVHMLSRAFNARDISTIRFNYRGVGKSGGEFGDSKGEVQDLLAIHQWINQIMPNSDIWLAGFSFGSYIAAAGATQIKCKQLFTICPSVENQPFKALPSVSCPWVIVQSTQDEVISPENVYQWFDEHQENNEGSMTMHKIEASHFYHGKLTVLRDLVKQQILV